MADQNYNTGDGLTRVDDGLNETRRPGRKPTPQEAEAILTLVRGGWLNVSLNVGEE